MANLGFYKIKREDSETGAARYSVRLVPYSVIDKQAVVELALKDSNINRQDMAVGFAALGQAIEDFVLNGHSVTLDGLGNFRLTCRTGIWDAQTRKWKSAGKDSMDDVSSNDIKGVYIRFRPCKALRQEINHANFFEVTNTLFGKTKGGKLDLGTAAQEPSNP